MDSWFYSVGSQQVGPVPVVEIRRLVQSGQLEPMASVWMSGAVAPLTAAQAVGGAPIGPDENALRYVVPTSQTSAMAIVAGYLGLFSLFMCPLGPFAFIAGVLGLRDLKRNPHKHGAGRAWTGIVCGTLVMIGTLIWLVLQNRQRQ